MKKIIEILGENQEDCAVLKDSTYDIGVYTRNGRVMVMMDRITASIGTGREIPTQATTTASETNEANNWWTFIIAWANTRRVGKNEVRT